MADKEFDFMDLFDLDKNMSQDELTERQWKIIEAAIEVFAEKGFDGSRTSEIAKEAEVAEGTIFRYYKTKKDLLMGLLIPFMSRFSRPIILKSVERIFKNKDNEPTEEVFKKIFEDRISLVRKNSKLLKTLFIEGAYHPELRDALQANIAGRIVPLVDNFMDDYIKKGEFKEYDPRFLTRSVISIVIGYVLSTAIFPEVFTVEDEKMEIEKMVDMLFNGILKASEGEEK